MNLFLHQMTTEMVESVSWGFRSLCEWLCVYLCVIVSEPVTDYVCTCLWLCIYERLCVRACVCALMCTCVQKRDLSFLVTYHHMGCAPWGYDNSILFLFTGNLHVMSSKI